MKRAEKRLRENARSLREHLAEKLRLPLRLIVNGDPTILVPDQTAKALIEVLDWALERGLK